MTTQVAAKKSGSKQITISASKITTSTAFPKLKRKKDPDSAQAESKKQKKETQKPLEDKKVHKSTTKSEKRKNGEDEDEDEDEEVEEEEEGSEEEGEEDEEDEEKKEKTKEKEKEERKKKYGKRANITKDTLPEGWTVKAVPRKKQNRYHSVDHYYTSPTGLTLRSLVEVERFLNGDKLNSF